MLMETKSTARLSGHDVFCRLLQNASVEITSSDKKSLETAIKTLAPDSEVFIASLPKDSLDRLITAAAQLRAAGLVPVPHLVARNITDLPALNLLLKRLVHDASIDRALVLGGDREVPAGNLRESLELVGSGLFEQHGIKKLYVGCYPEGHPRISNDLLDAALDKKMTLAEDAHLDVTLISQFCFDAYAILHWTERLRVRGVRAPFRVGLAGPASRASLLRYAMMCGIGPSLKVLRDREGLAQTMMSGETPEALLRELADGQARQPRLDIGGTHFFTFGALAKTVEWILETSAACS